MRAIDVNAHFLNLSAVMGDVQDKISGTMLATDLLVKEFTVNTQFTAAMWTQHVVTAERKLGYAFDFLKRLKFRNFDAVVLEIGIQQRAAVAAMNKPFGHIFAARGAWSAGPGRHRRRPAAVGMERLRISQPLLPGGPEQAAATTVPGIN